MINLDELLFQAYTLGVETDDKTAAFTKAQLRSVLFRSVPLLGKVESPAEKSDAEDSESEKPAKPAKKTTTATTKTKAEKTTSDPEKKPRKARATAGDEVRCHARTFNEKEHLENGKPKVMNADDEHNLYGGRCSAKKNGESDFCKMHAEKQAHGVWGGAYGDKCNGYIAQPEKEVKPKKTILKKAPATEPVAAAPKKVVKKAPKVEAEAANSDDDAEEHDDDEYMSSENKLEAAKIEYDWVEIDGEDYMIDAKGNVYDPENEEKIGNYNTKTKKWISGGPKDEADDE
jgi:hypothetical protein